MLKIAVCIALIAFVSAGHVEEHYSHPKYKFEYAVHDPHTHDIKKQWEARDGDVVKGSYSLVEPDGTLRVVEYSADKHNGFNAIVKREGHGHHPQVSYHGYGSSGSGSEGSSGAQSRQGSYGGDFATGQYYDGAQGGFGGAY